MFLNKYSSAQAAGALMLFFIIKRYNLLGAGGINNVAWIRNAR
jgi:hypothetical protein